MANQIIGKVFEIGVTTSIQTKSGNTFQKRQIVLDASHYDQYTGQKFENYPQFQFLQMNCAQLDNFKVGDIAVVSFAINGRSYEKDGVKKWINDIIGYKIEPYQRQQPSQQPTPQQQVKQPVQQSTQQQAPAQSVQQNAPSQQPFPPNVDAQGVPIGSDDDLPF